MGFVGHVTNCGSCDPWAPDTFFLSLGFGHRRRGREKDEDSGEGGRKTRECWFGGLDQGSEWVGE